MSLQEPLQQLLDEPEAFALLDLLLEEDTLGLLPAQVQRTMRWRSDELRLEIACASPGPQDTFSQAILADPRQQLLGFAFGGQASAGDHIADYLQLSLVIAALARAELPPTEQPALALRAGLHMAHHLIRCHPEPFRGTTHMYVPQLLVDLLQIVDGELFACHLSGFRLYRMREGRCRQITLDHFSVYGEMALVNPFGRMTTSYPGWTSVYEQSLGGSVGVHTLHCETYRLRLRPGDHIALLPPGAFTMEEKPAQIGARLSRPDRTLLQRAASFPGPGAILIEVQTG